MKISDIIPRKSEGLRLYEEFLRNLTSFLDFDSGEPYLSFAFASGHQILPLRDPRVWNLIVNRWVEAGHSAPAPASVRFALRTLEARTRRSDDRRIVSHRISGYGERFGPALTSPTRIVLDLHNKNGDVLHIDPDYWSIGEGASHCFTRGDHLLPLPQLPHDIFFTAGHVPPSPGTLAPELETLRTLLNPATDKDFHRCLLWLLTALRGPAPGEFPVLALEGGPQSGKSTAARILRHIVDPVTSSFTDAFLSRKELIEHARRNCVLAFDNIGKLTPRLAHFLNAISQRHERGSAGPARPARPRCGRVAPPGAGDPAAAAGPYQ